MSAAWSWWPAPAKLNLFLHVIGRCQDGYHELQTLFQLIDLCDSIGLRIRQDGVIQRLAGPSDVPAEKDLAIRAARALQAHTGVGLGADVQVRKSIPAGGGLGGGSSDAATVLLALDRLWGTGLPSDVLAQIGLRLGADVPLFVGGASAWGEGRGERLQPMSLTARWFLIVHPGCAISTAEIFQAPELTRNSPLITIRAFAAGQTTSNVCEPVARNRYPEVGAALDWLEAHIGASDTGRQARMTGTGACVFASFERAEDAERVAARVPDRWSSFVARGLDRSPLQAMLDVTR